MAGVDSLGGSILVSLREKFSECFKSDLDHPYFFHFVSTLGDT